MGTQLMTATDRIAPTLGEQLDQIMADMDAATTAWAEAGYPYEGPVYEAREAVYARLRAWTARAEQVSRRGALLR